MPNHGRLLHAKHLLPFVFAPWFQFRRVLLRLDWALFVPLRIASLWTASAVCGVVGVIGSILLFLFNAPPTPVAASTAEPTIVERIAITIPTELGPPVPMAPISVPVPIPTRTSWSDLQVRFARTHLPHGWDLREKQVLASRPEPLHPQSLYAIRDGWFAMIFNRQAQILRDTIQPYVSRPGVLASQILPPFSAAETIDPTQPVSKDRHPAIVVARENEAPASLHQETSYSLVVANPSPELIESAIVEERLSALHRVVNTDPPASLTADGSALQWNVANLRPGENRRLRVTLMPESSDPIQHQTFVTVTSRIAASTAIRQPYVPPEVPIARPTPPPAPSPQPILELDLERPQQVDLGGDVRAFYVIRNVGNAPANDVTTYVTISNNLDHRYGEYLEHRIPQLAAGDTRRIKFYAVGARPGIASLTSRLSASNAQAVSRVFEIAIAATGPGNSNSIASPGGPGVTDPRTFPGNNGPGEGFTSPSTPFPAPPGPGGSVPRSTVPTIARPDRDDGLPTRVPSTVPGQPGPGQTGFSQPGFDQPDSGIWRGPASGEQAGPMTSPFGPATVPNSGFSTTPDSRGRSTVPSESRPDLDDSIPLRVQSTVPEGSGPAGSVPRSTLPSSNGSAPYGQETNPFQTFPPGSTPSVPGASEGLPRNDGFSTAPGQNPQDRSGWRPGRSPNSTSPQPETDPRFAPGPGSFPNDRTNEFNSFPNGQPGQPAGFPNGQSGGMNGLSNGQPSGFSGFPNGQPTELGEPQPLPRSPERTRGPGRPIPSEEAGPSSSPFDPQPTSPFASPPPAFGGQVDNDRFVPPSEGAPAMNRPFTPAGPATTPGGVPLSDPFTTPDSSLPRPNSKPVFIPEPVESTIPGGARLYGPMPMVDPEVYPSLLPGNEFVPASGPQPFAPQPFVPQPFAPQSPFSPAAPEPNQPTPADEPKAI